MDTYTYDTFIRSMPERILYTAGIYFARGQIDDAGAVLLRGVYDLEWIVSIDDSQNELASTADADAAAAGAAASATSYANSSSGQGKNENVIDDSNKSKDADAKQPKSPGKSKRSAKKVVSPSERLQSRGGDGDDDNIDNDDVDDNGDGEYDEEGKDAGEGGDSSVSAKTSLKIPRDILDTSTDVHELVCYALMKYNLTALYASKVAAQGAQAVLDNMNGTNNSTENMRLQSPKRRLNASPSLASDYASQYGTLDSVDVAKNLEDAAAALERSILLVKREMVRRELIVFTTSFFFLFFSWAISHSV
jgi:hypothetical protein